VTSQRFGTARPRYLFGALIVLSVIAGLAVLRATNYMTFFWDEWDFVSYARGWNIALLMQPHNEHWSTVPLLLWKFLFVSVGIHSHIPYEAINLVAHISAVLLLFLIVRSRSGSIPAFAAAVILLFLGSGGTNIVWAFQIGFVGAVAFGLLAMALLVGEPSFPNRALLASVALTCSLMCSADGLPFLVAIAIELLLDARRRRFLFALIPPSIAFAEWFLAFGAGLPGTPGAPCPSCAPAGFSADVPNHPVGLSYVLTLSDFVITGLEATISGVFGAIDMGAALLPIVAFVLATTWFRQRKAGSWQVGILAGLLSWFILTSLGRAQNGSSAAEEPRYLYVGAVFLLPLLAHAVSELPWHTLWRLAAAAVFVICVAGNVGQLWERAMVDPVPSVNRDRGLNQGELMRIQSAELQTVEFFRGAPDMALNRSVDERIMPQLNAGPYLAATDELGSPVPKPTMSTLYQLPPDAVDRVMINLFGNALRVVSDDNGRSIKGMPCQDVDSSTGALIDLRVSEGQSVMLQSAKGGEAYFFLGFLTDPVSQPLQHLKLLPAAQQWVHLPQTGKPIQWRLWIRTSGLGTVKVCGGERAQLNSLAAFYFGHAAAGQLDNQWSSVVDAASSNGSAAKGAHGTSTTYHNCLFGKPFVPSPGTYDLWYRVRVSRSTVAEPQMKLGTWDEQAGGWVGSNIYGASQIGTDYSWIRVAHSVTAPPGHPLQFLASFSNRLSADWYVDDAVLVPISTEARSQTNHAYVPKLIPHSQLPI